MGDAMPYGSERKAQNGYWYVKVDGRGWTLKHWLVAEEELGRKIDTNKESTRFVDGNKNNLNPENILVVPKDPATLKRRIATHEQRINQLNDQLGWLKAQLPKD